jgi:hypothetical protein
LGDVRSVIVLLLVCPEVAAAAGSVRRAANEGASAVQHSALVGEGEPAEPREPVSLSAEVGIVSRGVWRGTALGDPSVLQTSGEVTYHDATFSLGNSVFVGRSARSGGELAGFDMNLAYDFESDSFALTPELNIFAYSGSGQTTEVAGTLSYGFGEMSLHTRHAVDVAANRGGWYGQGGAAWSTLLPWRLALDLNASVAWCSGAYARYYWNESVDGPRIGVAALASGLTLTVTDAVFMRFNADGSSLLASELRESVGSDAQLFVAGLAVGFTN